MVLSLRNPSQSSKTQKRREEEAPWLSVSLKPENFLPGIVIGFLLGLFMDLSRPQKRNPKFKSVCAPNKQQMSNSGDEELKMVLVVRQDLKMGAGKIASQCAHAATGTYAELMISQRSLLRQWEQCGQAKIVVTCKNQQEMNKLKEAAESIGLPTFIVADAGRTQVSAGSKTVLAIGPGRKTTVDSITGRLRLL
ncbi:hypothetical protein QJS10_CPB18g01046 [Acorus calamus]|uniref:peptidyl-tRNA hydrolase n=1 Tax=Acorus calamus TaxID=4465 RepID=A0AAV9CMK6_ACOCL|nr:hypothetical protein QJS10_CPB18g01046 [Acorus calamus]